MVRVRISDAETVTLSWEQPDGSMNTAVALTGPGEWLFSKIEHSSETIHQGEWFFVGGQRHQTLAHVQEFYLALYLLIPLALLAGFKSLTRVFK